MQFIKDGTPELGPDYLEPTEFFDFDVEAVRNFAYETIGDEDNATAKAVKLYYETEEAKEGGRAFREKRPPEFRSK